MTNFSRRIAGFALVWACACLPFIAGDARAQQETVSEFENLKAPPRSIDDVLKAVDPSLQDFSLVAQAKKSLAARPPNSADHAAMNEYYFRRAHAFVVLGELKEIIDTYKTMIEKYPNTGARLTQDYVDMALAQMKVGNVSGTIQTLEAARGTISKESGNRLSLATVLRIEIRAYLSIGAVDQAVAVLAEFDKRTKNLNNNIDFNARQGWVSQLEWSRASIFIAMGKPLEAERSLRQAAKVTLELARNARQGSALESDTRTANNGAAYATTFWTRLMAIYYDLSKAYLSQNRFVESELAAREGLKLAIRYTGITSPDVAWGLNLLSQILSDQGRLGEAVLLANTSFKILEKSGASPASIRMTQTRTVLAKALVADGKYAQADKVYTDTDNAVRADPDSYALFRQEDLGWVTAKIRNNKAAEAAALAADILARQAKRYDKNSPTLARTRALHAVALQAEGQSAQAETEYKAAVPILLNRAQTDAENSTASVAQQRSLGFILGSYLALLAQTAQSESSVATSFQIADVARGSGVQRALTSSAARASIKDPELARLAREEQDLQRRIAALSDLLTGLLSASPDQQLPEVQGKIRSELETLKAQREQARKTIEGKFPDYAELVDPKPASIEGTRKLLKADEVLLAWYFAETVGYVWAVTKDAPAQFVQIPVSRATIAKEVATLRKALDPSVSTIEEIPPFDVALANKLYAQLIAPVQSSIEGKRVILAVPHAELGQLPLSLLVKQPVQQPSKSAIPFSEYRDVPWLARDIAIEQMPSVTALTALRSLKAGSSSRKAFVGFGDPYFSRSQMTGAQKQAPLALASRGVPIQLRSAPKLKGVSSAELSLLPRLPDTSQEIEEVGRALGAGAGDIYLNQNATVKQVTGMNLTDRKVVMFSTHGLVPGELNGLTQPALALSSPDVTGDHDDGLLTLDKVIALKLDADWVVLSACNTAAGDGAGTEAVSGLGRAFFFAGARALLVSNWPVDSAAARELMTDIFARQQKAPSRPKAEVLREAMIDEIDNGGMKDAGVIKYSYAHPLFWAPFVLVGD